MIRGHKNARTDLTYEFVRRLFRYDPETGFLHYEDTRHVRKTRGTVAGTSTQRGYIRVVIQWKHYFAHRIIWLWVTGRWPEREIDHIDGNVANNRWENLREATSSQNLHNRGPQINNTSGFKGISKMGNRWVAEIQSRGVRHRLGYFKTPQEAAEAYKEASIRLRGIFSKT